MAANKENERESEYVMQSAAERRLQNKNDEAIQNSAVPPRDPLRTLASKNVDNISEGPSQKPIKKLDTRFVTHRTNDEGLDWNLEVFRDNLNKSLFKHGIKDELYRELESLQSDAQDTIEVTPAAGNSNYHTGLGILKKVKKSLKRPQSRGQQNEISPNSLCTHSNSSFQDLSDDYVLDNINYLLESEKKMAGEPMLRKASRTCVINWIININGSSGNSAVVQTACWYLDNYLSVCIVSVSKLQVIAAACFWIATKLIGQTVSSRRLVKYSGRAFTEKDLVDAEKTVLRKVKFQATPVVADDFVPYLSYCCSNESSASLVEAASTFICQCGFMTEKLSSDDYPSVIAAAAVLTALELLKKNSCKDKLKACPIFKAIEDKASNITETCNKLRESVLTVSSVGYEYKAPLFKFSGPPHYVSTKIIHAITIKKN